MSILRNMEPLTLSIVKIKFYSSLSQSSSGNIVRPRIFRANLADHKLVITRHPTPSTQKLPWKYHASGDNSNRRHQTCKMQRRRGGSNEYPQSMFWSRNKKNNVHPCKPQFYNIKLGFKGVKII